MEIRDIECRLCRQVTHHEVLFEHAESGTFDDWYQWRSDYFILKCRGCDAITMASEDSNSEDIEEDERTGGVRHTITSHLYPPRGSGQREPDPTLSFQVLPANLLLVYHETLTALNNDARILAAIGLRALVEGLCSDKKVRGRGLIQKIDGLVAEGILPREHGQYLHMHRVIGNRAAHELATPTMAELNDLLAIVEQLLRTTYVVPHIANRLGPNGGAEREDEGEE